jgi:hypothetical protein
MEPAPADVTSLLNKLAGGDQEAGAQLVPLVYEELRRLPSVFQSLTPQTSVRVDVALIQGIGKLWLKCVCIDPGG